MNTVYIKDGHISIDVDDLLGQLSADHLKEILKRFSVSERVIEWVIAYLCGDDEDGWWTGDDANLRQRLLVRVQNSHLADDVLLSWNVFDELRKRLKDIRSKQHVYWFLYHELPDHLRCQVMNLMEQAGVESNYTTKQADADIERIEKMANETFRVIQSQGTKHDH